MRCGGGMIGVNSILLKLIKKTVAGIFFWRIKILYRICSEEKHRVGHDIKCF